MISAICIMYTTTVVMVKYQKQKEQQQVIPC